MPAIVLLQYNGPFQAKRLGNWCSDANPCVMTWKPKFCPPPLRGPEPWPFIADDNGHLLPRYKAKFSRQPRLNWGPNVLRICDEEEHNYGARQERLSRYRMWNQCL